MIIAVARPTLPSVLVGIIRLFDEVIAGHITAHSPSLILGLFFLCYEIHRLREGLFVSMFSQDVGQYVVIGHASKELVMDFWLGVFDFGLTLRALCLELAQPSQTFQVGVEDPYTCPRCLFLLHYFDSVDQFAFYLNSQGLDSVYQFVLSDAGNVLAWL